MTTNPPGQPGTYRGVPERMPTDQQARLRSLLDSQTWVLRGQWEQWLRGHCDDAPVPVESLTRDHCVAAAAWLSQQRHMLYRALGHGSEAPDAWLTSLPLYRALTARHSTLRMTGTGS